MKKFPLFVALAVACAAAPLLAPASAQELNLGPMIDPMVGANAAAMDHAASDAYERKLGHTKGRAAYEREMRRLKEQQMGSGRTVRGHGSRPASSGSTRFRPDLTARRRMVATWTAKTRAANPQVAANLQRELAGREPIAVIGANIARYGLRTDDVADAIAVYLVSSWEDMHGNFGDPALAPVRATSAQMHQVLLSNRKFASSSNAVKQQLAEALLLQMVVDSQSVSVAKGNPAQLARAQSNIRQNVLSILKIDLSKMKLTNQGLRL